jgi:hypothetical protein
MWSKFQVVIEVPRCWWWVFASCCVCEIQVMRGFVPSTQHYCHRVFTISIT